MASRVGRPSKNESLLLLNLAKSAPLEIGRPESFRGTPFVGAEAAALAKHMKSTPDRVRKWITSLNAQMVSIGTSNLVDLEDFAEKFAIRFGGTVGETPDERSFFNEAQRLCITAANAISSALEGRDLTDSKNDALILALRDISANATRLAQVGSTNDTRHDELFSD